MLRWLSKFINKFEHFLIPASKMDKNRLLVPPAACRGMTRLDRAAFTIRLDVPVLYVPANRHVSTVVARLKRNDLLLKYKVKVNLKRQRENSNDNEKPEPETLVALPLNPEKFDRQLPDDVLQLSQSSEWSPVRTVSVSIDYDLWTKEDIFEAVLPKGLDTVSGYSLVGHIVHVNLKEALAPYKPLIGQVLLDKVKQAKTVINKVNKIDNEFRNFEIELLAGEPNYVTRVRENGCLFELDYSKVYWNSRLSTEHKRIVDLIKKGDLVFDGFAGIGPFAVLAAKSFAEPKKKSSSEEDDEIKTHIVANDLNPESVNWLRRNLELNHVEAKCHNLDAADFFRDVVKEQLREFLANSGGGRRAHVIMNLPASAITFLPHFRGLLFERDRDQETIEDSPLPVHVYCYTFVKGADDSVAEAVRLACLELGPDGEALKNQGLVVGYDVRNVAPMKQMICVQLQLTRRLLFSNPQPKLEAPATN